MDTRNKHISKNYKALKYWYNILWSILLFALLIYMIWAKKLTIDFQDLTNTGISILFILIGTIAIRDTIHMLFGGLKIVITSNKLVASKNNGLFIKKKEYQLEKINNLEVHKNEFNGYRWNWGGLIWKDSDNEILTFRYENRKIILGKKIKNFNASELENNILDKRTE